MRERLLTRLDALIGEANEITDAEAAPILANLENIRHRLAVVRM